MSNFITMLLIFTISLVGPQVHQDAHGMMLQCSVILGVNNKTLLDKKKKQTIKQTNRENISTITK